MNYDGVAGEIIFGKETIENTLKKGSAFYICRMLLYNNSAILFGTMIT